MPVDGGKFRIPAGATGSKAYAEVAASGGATTSLKKNGTQFGTVQWSAAAQTGSFSVASDTDFDPATPDRLTVVAPSAPDADHADIMIHLKGRLL